MRTLFAILFFGSAFLASENARAAGGEYPTVWTGVVLATTEAKPAAMLEKLAPFAPKLENIFGYNHFALLGEHTEIMDDPHEHWLVPGHAFSLMAASERSTTGAGYSVKLELFRERRMLVATKVWLTPRSPLFIKGPLCGKGQLIIVLVVQ